MYQLFYRCVSIVLVFHYGLQRVIRKFTFYARLEHYRVFLASSIASLNISASALCNFGTQNTVIIKSCQD